MRRLPAHRLSAIAGRLLLAVALVFSTGPWAELLASTLATDCPHAAAGMHYDGADGDHDCCPNAHAGGDDLRDCGKHGSACPGDCIAVCGMGWPAGLPVAAVLPGLRLIAAAPIARLGYDAPPPASPPALRPPISA